MQDGFGGLYMFPTVDDFIDGRPALWRQAFGAAETNFHTTSFGAFIQDRFRPAPQVTLNLGVRYDIERIPELFRTDTWNMSPRIGIVWNPSSRWIFRSAFGLYHDRIPLAFLNRAIQKNGVQAFEQVADGDAASKLFVSSGGRVALPVGTIAP